MNNSTGDAIAYEIDGAARAASVSAHAIEVAIKEKRLTARKHGHGLLILRTDLQQWLEGLPVF